MFTYKQIQNKDALNYINELKKENILVDAIITDSPYNILSENNFATTEKAGIGFGYGNKKFNQEKLITEIAKLIKKEV